MSFDSNDLAENPKESPLPKIIPKISYCKDCCNYYKDICLNINSIYWEVSADFSLIRRL